MNYEAIEAHLELHLQVLAVIKTKVPEKKVFSFGNIYTLSDIVIQDDGGVRADYSRYIGCGEYEHETEFLDLRALFHED